MMLVICRLAMKMIGSMEDEEIIIEQEYIDEAKAQMAKDPALRPCQMCFHYDPVKKWCRHMKKPKMHYKYGAACFLTSEQALRALLIQERRRAIQQRAKLHEKLDVMNIMVSGADLIREDILQMLEAEYDRLDIKAKSDEETYRKSKKNLDRLAKCYAQMKMWLQKFESEHRRYVEYWDAQVFADNAGIFNPEYDKHKHNIGFCTYQFFALYDTMFECEENVKAFIDFVNGLQRKRKSILDQNDLKRYLIKI